MDRAVNQANGDHEAVNAKRAANVPRGVQIQPLEVANVRRTTLQLGVAFVVGLVLWGPIVFPAM